MRTSLLLLLVVAVLATNAVDVKKKKKKFPCECLDICFVIDISGSVIDSFPKVREFLCNFILSFSNPPDDVQFCALAFTTKVLRFLDFDDRCNRQKGGFYECKNKITNLATPTFGGTNLEAALRFVLSNIFPGKDGDRPDDECPDVLIIITDGKTYPDPSEEANALLAAGVNIFVAALDRYIDLNVLKGLVGPGNLNRLFRMNDIDNLTPTVNALRTEVCDSKGFDPACQTCCCGELFGDHHKPCPDRKNKCCGKYKWNPRKIQAVCCQGYWFVGYDERWTRCCYDKPYNIKHYTCCYNRIVPATKHQDQCCGFIAFNQKHEICCNYKVYKKLKHTRCCYDVAYNPKWEICCRYRVRDGCEYEHRCCGSRAYNPHHEVCCNPYYERIEDNPSKYCGQAIELPCGYHDVWDPKWHTCCCGWKHNGGVTRKDGCCRHLRYNLHTHLCCDGYLVEADPEWNHCCGRYAYDIWTHTCCHGYFLVEGVGQCCGYYKVFNHKHEICCGGQWVFKGHPCRTKCCYSYYYGHRAYDTKKQLCCYGYVRKGGRHWYCCGYYSYNIKTHMCCYGRILARKDFRRIGWCEYRREYDDKVAPDDGDPADAAGQDPPTSVADEYPAIADDEATIADTGDDIAA